MFIIVAVILSELKKSLEKEKHSSRTDYLTQLANTKSFMESLNMEAERARRYGHPFSVAYIDVDNFKLVNDKRGHQAGDELLRNVAETLRSVIRQTDMVGRMGGDEFCVLLPETDQKKAADVMRRLGEELNKLVYLGNYEISFSIGCVTFKAVPNSLDEIIQKADDLMYQVKKEGKNQIYYSLYTESS
jgi:diguanylate cyclase (GGDEF)-like protein